MTNENKKFVIQQHSSGPDIHWDFMLQISDTLQTYRLDKAPQELAQTPANAVKIFDHPLKFLTYEGPVNKGRGNVQIADSGTYKILRQSNDCLELNLNGKLLKGKFTLLHTEGDNWHFSKSGI
jgi:hypothetical protein